MSRVDLTTEQRTRELKHTIDPGFVNHRKIQTLLGEDGMRLIDKAISQLPNNLPDWEKPVRIDHIYKEVLLIFCKTIGIKTLCQLLPSFRGIGAMFCSTENFLPCPNVYDSERVSSKIDLCGNYNYEVEIHYTTKHISSSTIKSRLHQGAPLSVIAELHQVEGNKLIFHPFLIGSPWLTTDNPAWESEIMWWAYEYYENYIEDFDQFNKVNDIPEPKDFNLMRNISEKAFKSCLAEILGDPVKKDWGGETSDHYTAHIHLNGKRVNAAFLLKGPSNFSPMTLNHLGKNNDQIYRLSTEPADVLIVQHCHEITPAVRATLRAFAVQPANPRRYCLIDGRDSLRLLQAYNLYDKATELSR